MQETRLGIAGRVARAFIDSKLTPLIVAASLLLGLFAVKMTPREEEPQISVPMVDLYLPMPGSSPREVQERVVKPFEGKLWEIPGVEYLYSMSRPGVGIITVRYKVGENMEESLVKLYNKVMSNKVSLPPGAGEPLVVAKSIDDVPILALTVWSEHYDHGMLRKVAREICDELKKSENVSEAEIKGGLSRQIKVSLNSSRLAGYSLSPLQVAGTLQTMNSRLPSGSYSSGNRETLVEAGALIDSEESVKRLVVGVHKGRPVYLADVAEVSDTVKEPEDYVFMGLGSGAAEKGLKASNTHRDYPAVTISIAKRKGANATWVADDLLKKVEFMKGKVIPSDVQVTVTRNYGETAREKNNELLFHMFLAAISVTILIAMFMGWRAGAVAAIAIPVTLALTMLVFYLIGYTLNRITLFALIFSIGILVDDAIVVVENVHRYFTTTLMKPIDAAIKAVDEIGNPTVLATFAVIASILPMGFVGGLMGPYMRPIPVGASMAMLLSMFIAFIVTPYFAYRLMKGAHHNESEEIAESKLTIFYRHWMGRLIHDKRLRNGFLTLVVGLFLASCSLIYFKAVTVKMLPFDNKNELQVIVDAPEGTPLEQTARITREMGDALRSVPEVTDFQIYIGTSAPFNFNGLVRHYFLRKGPNLADIQVNLLHKGDRKAQSHDIAKKIRPILKAVSDRYGARVKVAEIPPGPPVLSTLVAEVYGPSDSARASIASRIMGIFGSTAGVVDADWYREADQPKLSIEVDREKAALAGIPVDQVSKALRIALNGLDAGLLHAPKEKEPVAINLRLPESSRSSAVDLSSLHLTSPGGASVPLSQLVRTVNGSEEKTLYRKNLKDVIYVIGDVAGAIEAPVYAILKMQKQIAALPTPDGSKIEILASRQPWSEEKMGMKWDGEWHITYEVFRDLGVAFAAVMVLIYILVVAWFKDFTTPIVIMAPIPLTLIGILPGHAMFGAFFTATSMIGFIALAGIIVRNSIILIDFAEMKRREGMALDEAIIEAGAVRFRPMLLTAAAVVVGSFVIVFDPIFQGLAIAMMCGEIASTTLSRVTIPILYYLVQGWKEKHHKAEETCTSNG